MHANILRTKPKMTTPAYRSPARNVVPIPLCPHHNSLLLAQSHFMAFVLAVLSAYSILLTDVLMAYIFTSCSSLFKYHISEKLSLTNTPSLLSPLFCFNFLQNAYHILIMSYIYLLLDLSVAVENKSHDGRDSVLFTTLSPAPRTQVFSKYLLNGLGTGIETTYKT